MGDLTLGGSLNVTNGGSFSPGAYRLINYAGSLTELALTLGSLPAGFSGANVAVTTGVPGQVNLVVSGAAGGEASQFWDGSNNESGTVHVVLGGGGTWSTGTTNFINALVTMKETWQNGLAVFNGTPGMVTLGNDISFEGIQFSTLGYTIVGSGALALVPIGTAVVIVDTAVTGTIAAPINGPGGLDKDGPGKLILSGVNGYSGGTRITNGILSVANNPNLGSPAGGITLDGGELLVGAGFASARTLFLTTNGGTIAAVTGGTGSFSGDFTGVVNGNLIVGDPANSGLGRIALSGVNSYFGNTTIVDGVTLEAFSRGAFSPNSAYTVTGTLDLNGNNFTTGGVSAGVDYRLTDSVAIGLMGEYSHSWTSLNPGGSLDVSSGRGGLYGTWSSHGMYLNGAIYGGGSDYSSSRAGLKGVANGSSSGAQWSTFASGGYDFHFGRLTVGPVAALQYTDVSMNSFSEDGSLAPLDIHSGSAESLRSDFGLRVFYAWKIGNVTLEPSLKAAWEHEYKYSALPITAGFAGIPGPSVTFTGPAIGQNSAVVSAGISAQFSSGLSLYLNYDGQLGRSNYNSNAVTGGAKVSF